MNQGQVKGMSSHEVIRIMSSSFGKIMILARRQDAIRIGDVIEHQGKKYRVQQMVMTTGIADIDRISVVVQEQ